MKHLTLIALLAACFCGAQAEAAVKKQTECSDQATPVKKAPSHKHYKRTAQRKPEKMVEMFGGEMGPKAAAAGTPHDLQIAGAQGYESYNSVMVPQKEALNLKKKQAKANTKSAD